MVKLVRVKEWSKIAGVCSGLEACDNGSSLLWRLAFVLLALFGGGGLLIYVVMAIILPEEKTVQDAKKISSIRVNAEQIEEQLRHLESMKEKGLIDESEYQKLRKRTIGLWSEFSKHCLCAWIKSVFSSVRFRHRKKNLCQNYGVLRSQAINW